jgi:hypothetical protein
MRIRIQVVRYVKSYTIFQDKFNVLTSFFPFSYRYFLDLLDSDSDPGGHWMRIQIRNTGFDSEPSTSTVLTVHTVQYRYMRIKQDNVTVVLYEEQTLFSYVF